MMLAMRAQWTPEEAREWYGRWPWLVGCNFIPSTAVNQLEMWQAETFDPEVIDRELGGAEGLGFNCARVYLHDLLWAQVGFLDRMERYLEIAWGHGIATMFVLLDGVWDPEPTAGPQGAGRPRVHNSGWVQSPGAAILGDPARHGELEPYVKGVIERFRDDERVLAWDLFNEPDNGNLAYRDREIPDKAEKAFALLRRVYEWAREAGPSQPLTAGVWDPAWVNTGALSDIGRYQLEESDVVSFHAYTGPRRLGARLDELSAYGRPVLLTEYMSRGFGSTFERVLPVAKERGVGAFCWGLVAGKTQTIYPWDSWAKRYDEEPSPWFHDVLRPDGSPYDEYEAAFLREITEGPV
jgi:hypothetical protein